MLPMSTQASFGMTAADLTWLANDLVRRPTLWPLGNQGVSARSVAVSAVRQRGSQPLPMALYEAADTSAAVRLGLHSFLPARSGPCVGC